MANQELLARLRKNGTMLIAPEDILGFRVGRPLDFLVYSKLGFNHPRNPEYYNLDNNPHPQIAGYFDGINKSKSIDDPVEVYIHNDDIIVLDGATRLTCIAFIKRAEPEAFAKVPVRLFKGTDEEAKIRMIRRNWEESKKPLTQHEFLIAVIRLKHDGIRPEAIAEGLGKSKSYYPYIYKMISAYQTIIPDWLKELENETIPLTNILEIAANDRDTQEELLESHRKGEKVTVKKAKEKAKARPPRFNVNKWTDSIGDKMGDLASHLKAFNKLELFQEQLLRIEEALCEIEMQYAKHFPEKGR